ncbi:hypothetical protein CLAIMM_12488 [Cladophialophora immunda]|nr:hypothetical protein CLAIMM_12488 [Cladophialophora immunda]
MAKPLHDVAANNGNAEMPTIAIFNANDPETTTELLVAALERDGCVIVENLITEELTSRIRSELKPVFDKDQGRSDGGFFPSTTQRAPGVVASSDACVELALNKTYIDVADRVLTSTYAYWAGQERHTISAKPIISSTFGFRVNPGGKQQVLHRDDSDYHARDVDRPVMLGCVTALSKTTKANGATMCIPGSHLWGPERCPYDHEAIPAELEPGSALIFDGGLYHAGGGNVTTDQARETVGIFLQKPTYRQAENQFLVVPPEKAKRFSPQAQRLLGYGICPPSLGGFEYKDPMLHLFSVEDEETVYL